jgi:hypothetical protein
MVKYLKPQKNGYLNESQDRVIKKKAFKVENLPTGVGAMNPELGFFAIVPADKLSDADYAETLLSNDKVNGLSCAFAWNTLEPTEETFNFDPIDKLLAACERHHKTLILRVIACGLADGGQSSIDGTPKWVFDSGSKSISYQAADGSSHTMPLFWDKNYLAKWSNFVGELAERYDRNPTIHSIGITGGGFGIGTSVGPVSADRKSSPVAEMLKQNYGMNQRQLVEHWKYVADLFPKKFQTARLNFNINEPVRGKMGEESLDEIADYLVYRYGERIYLTRSGLKDGKHAFNDYRLLLKFHKDTLTGIRVADTMSAPDFPKAAKYALDDGISFAEMPAALLTSADSGVQSALSQLDAHIGYELVIQKASIPAKVAAGQPLTASFEFVNAGAAPAMRPERNIDKDAPMSYRVQIELRNAEGKPVLQNVHTPPAWTSSWEPGKPVAWDEELKMVDGEKHQLPPGEYSVWMSVVDPGQKRKIQFLHATSDGKMTSGETVEVGKLTITASVAETPQNQAVGASQDKH